MTTDESLQRFGLVPRDAHLAEVRALLAREADAERAGHQREEDLALLCCVQLFSRGRLEDVLRIWAAKTSGFDLGSYLDVQLLCGAGLSETIEFLDAQPSTEAHAALDYIRKCQRAGDFDGFSPAGYLDDRRKYFGATA